MENVQVCRMRLCVQSSQIFGSHCELGLTESVVSLVDLHNMLLVEILRGRRITECVGICSLADFHLNEGMGYNVWMENLALTADNISTFPRQPQPSSPPSPTSPKPTIVNHNRVEFH